MKTVKIKGMSCGHCVMAVTKALGGIAGIKNVQVDLKNGAATFEEETGRGACFGSPKGSKRVPGSTGDHCRSDQKGGLRGWVIPRGN